MASDGWHRMEDALELLTTGTDVIVTCKQASAYHSFPCIVAGNEVRLRCAFARTKKACCQDRREYSESDLQSLEEVVSKICWV